MVSCDRANENQISEGENQKEHCQQNRSVFCVVNEKVRFLNIIGTVMSGKIRFDVGVDGVANAVLAAAV